MSTENLPKKIAIFPLAGAIFFPKTTLPLNIFEKKYIQLVGPREPTTVDERKVVSHENNKRTIQRS